MASCGKYLPAKMDKRVTLQNVSFTSDGQGGQTETWSDTADLWASIEPVKAWEKMQAMQMQAPVTHKITIRYRSDVSSKSRFQFGTRTLWVKEVINKDEANQFLELKAIERA